MLYFKVYFEFLTCKHFISDIKDEIYGIHRNLMDNEVRYVKRLVEREAKGLVVVLRRDKKTKLANLLKFDSDVNDEDDEDDEDGQDDGEIPSSTGSSPSSLSGSTSLKAAPRKRLGGRVVVEEVEVNQYSRWLM